MKFIQANRERVNRGESDRGLTMRERAKKARHAAYLVAKERQKNDPRLIERKAKLKQARREANAQAKERRKSDPVQLGFKAKIKRHQQDVRKKVKEQRKVQAGATKSAERAAKETHMKGALGFASALPSSEPRVSVSVDIPPEPGDS